MPKLRALKGVASTLATMFVSRNNDADGYWGIGKLCSAAASRGHDEIEIDLLANPADWRQVDDLSIVHSHYASELTKQLRSAHVGDKKLKSAVIKVRFGVPNELLKRYERFGYGEPVECVVKLQTEAGHACEASARCRAAPHNPEHESRRNERMALTSHSSGRATPAA
ncbi:MAG: hypothetical protein NTZ11_00135 [Gammaproteobacteria bacterium]|nr:hypothetical protein [Gammaproteobacteria bacterium]